MFAIRKNHDQIVTILLEHGANPNVQNNEGKTAIVLAGVNRLQTMVDMLLEHETESAETSDNNDGCSTTSL